LISSALGLGPNFDSFDELNSMNVLNRPLVGALPRLAVARKHAAP
jgi:hypothetical protein